MILLEENIKKTNNTFILEKSKMNNIFTHFYLKMFFSSFDLMLTPIFFGPNFFSKTIK
jgi:hypothetical protein